MAAARAARGRRRHAPQELQQSQRLEGGSSSGGGAGDAKARQATGRDRAMRQGDAGAAAACAAKEAAGRAWSGALVGGVPGNQHSNA